MRQIHNVFESLKVGYDENFRAKYAKTFHEEMGVKLKMRKSYPTFSNLSIVRLSIPPHL